HQGAIFGILPNSEFADRTADHFGARIAVPSLERRIHIYKAPFIDGGDGKRDRARTKDLLKLVLGYPASLLRLFQRFFCLAKICQTPLKLGPGHLSALVETRILDRRSGV